MLPCIAPVLVLLIAELSRVVDLPSAVLQERWILSQHAGAYTRNKAEDIWSRNAT